MMMEMRIMGKKNFKIDIMPMCFVCMYVFIKISLVKKYYFEMRNEKRHGR